MLTRDNACNLDEEVNLKKYLEPSSSNKKDAKDRRDTLHLFLECRVPKVFQLVQILKTPILNARGGNSMRNAVVYIPTENSNATEVDNTLRDILKASLQLEDLTDTERLRTHYKPIDDNIKALEKAQKAPKTHKPPAPLAPPPSPKLPCHLGYIFQMRREDSSIANHHNKMTKAVFAANAIDGRTNVLILAKRHYQSTDIRGANCIFRLQPFTRGKTRQIVGRVHRNNAQIQYKDPQLLENYALFYKPSTRGTLLSCDTLIQHVYDVAEAPEHTVEDIMRGATLACKAMNNLRRDGLVFLPESSCTLPEEKRSKVYTSPDAMGVDTDGESSTSSAREDKQRRINAYTAGDAKNGVGVGEKTRVRRTAAMDTGR